MAASETVPNIPQRVKTEINGDQRANETENGLDKGDHHNGRRHDKPDAANTSRPASPQTTIQTQQYTTNTQKIRNIVQQSASEESKIKINNLLTEIRQLPDLEKLLLYLQLPTGTSSNEQLRQSSTNPLGTRFEVTQTITWIKTHLEEDGEVSLPKHEVYEDYCQFCHMHAIKPLSTADFGKIMKHVFPRVRPRRLGTRGNSKYCYAGLRKKINLDVPKLPDLSSSGRELNRDEINVNQDTISACSYVILEWAHKLLENKFETLKELACHLVESKLVDVRSFGAFTVLSLLPNTGKGSPASVLLNQSGGSKHRDTQLHLQRKLHEKELIREQKKRLHELRVEKDTPKERRRAASGPCGRTTRSSNGKGMNQVCSMPSTPLPSRDSPPICKMASKLNGVNDVDKKAKPKVGKVQIPRISSNRQSPKVCLAPPVPATSIIFVPHVPHISELGKCGKAKTKYKPIQPKPSATTQSTEPTGRNGGDKNGESTDRASKRQNLTDEQTPIKRIRPETEENGICEGDLLGEKTAEGLFADQDVTHKSRDFLLSQSSCEPPKVSDEELMQLLDNEDEVRKHEEIGNALMDLMDGSSASMEQDEELSHYFSEPVTAPPTPTKRTGDAAQSDQLTQLRWLLEHNLKPSPPATSHTLRKLLTQGVSKSEDRSSCENQVKPQEENSEMKADNEPLPPMEMLTGFSFSQHAAELAQSSDLNSAITKRRVSFPINLNEAANLDCPSSSSSSLGHALNIASSVPPSPNTRCRSFNFTPISPRHTPLPTENKAPSTTASPFMSPSSTPVPHCRSRHNSGQALSSYGTTPRSTPFPSEHSSAVNSPFISPHPTPVPFCRSRHNSNQSRMQQFPTSTAQISLNVLNTQRSRHSSGATAMTLMSPRSAPLSPMNYIGEPETNNNQFSMPSVGDTPQMRSRHNSNSSIPPMSPCSAPMSPNNGLLPSLSINLQQPSMDGAADEWTHNGTQGYSNVVGGSTWYPMAGNDPRTLARQRHASMGGTVHHLPSNICQQQQVAMRMLLQRSQSVPQQHQMQVVESNNNYSYPATPTTSQQFTDLMQFAKNDDLGATLEDLRACDDDFSQFAQEFEHQSNVTHNQQQQQQQPMMITDDSDDVFPSKTY